MKLTHEHFDALIKKLLAEERGPSDEEADAMFEHCSNHCTNCHQSELALATELLIKIERAVNIVVTIQTANRDMSDHELLLLGIALYNAMK